MIEPQKGKPSITRLDPPKRSKRTDLRKTGLIWSKLREETRKAVRHKLQSEFALPREYEWSLLDAESTSSRPSLFTRLLSRLVSDLDHTTDKDAVYIVAFVASFSYQGEGQAFLQIESERVQSNDYVMDHKKSGSKASAGKEKKKKKVVIEDAVDRQEDQRFGDPFQNAYLEMDSYAQYPGTSMPSFAQHQDPSYAQYPDTRSPEKSHQGKFDDFSNVREGSGRLSVPERASEESTSNRRTQHRYKHQAPEHRSHVRPREPPAIWSSPRTYVSSDSDRGERHYPNRPVGHFRRRESSGSRPYVDERDRHRPARGFDYERDRLDDRDDFWHNTDSEIPRYDYWPTPNGYQRGSSDERSRPGSPQSDDAELQELSDESLDDAELFDQLLHKFTGHGLQESVAVNEQMNGSTGEQVNEGVDESTNEDFDGRVSGVVNGENDEMNDGIVDVMVAGTAVESVDENAESDDEDVYHEVDQP